MKIVLRIILDIAITVTVVYGWWYVALPVMILSAWLFRYHIESVVAGFAYDSLFAVNGQEDAAGLYGHIGLAVGVAVVLIMPIVKRSFR